MATNLKDLIDTLNAEDIPTNIFTIEDEDPNVILGKLNEVIAYLEKLQSSIDSSDTKANKAIADALSAIQTAQEALTTANGIDSKATQALENATTALSTANTAISSSNTALSTANTAISTANTAISSANSAVETATNANTKSTNAVNIANSASETANGIDAKATQALENSSNALNTANTANTNASNAVNTANSALEQVIQGQGTKVYNRNTLLSQLDIKPYVNYNNYFNVTNINEYGKIFTSGKLLDSWDTISMIVILFDKNATNVTADASAYLIRYRGNGSNPCSLTIKRLWGINQFDNSLYVDYVNTAFQNSNSNYFELYYKSGYQGDDSKGISIQAYLHRKGVINNDYTIYNGTLSSLTEITTIGQTSLFKDIVTHNYLTNNETENIDGYKTFTKTVSLKNTDNAYNDTPDTGTTRFLSFIDKNSVSIANIFNTIGSSWNALNFQLKGKNNVTSILEYVCSGNDTDGYTWRLDPVTDNLVDLGTSARRWKDLYLSNKVFLKSIKFDIERPWQIEQGGSGVGTTLDLKSNIDGKHFRIVSPLKTNGFRFAVSETNDSNNLMSPLTDNIAVLGQSNKRFKDLYLAGNLSDGTNSVKVSEIVNLADEQTIPGLKNFDNAKFKVSEGEYRAPLTSPAAANTDKKYLIGVSKLSDKHTNINSNCYMQDGKLYSNGGQTLTNNYDWIDDVLSGNVGYGDKIVGKSIGSNGYIKFVSGLLIQWGSYSRSSASGDFQDNISLPTVFSNTNYKVLLSSFKDTTDMSYRELDLTILKKYTSYFTFAGYGNSQTWKVDWIAIGY